MDAISGEAVAHAARVLRETAQTHKKAVRYHRKAARDCMQKLREICEAHGIKLSIMTGGEKHGPNIDGTDDGCA